MSIHFVGIGGVSMSALAKIMQKRGATVTGSDLYQTRLDGITTYIGHCADFVRSDCDLVVYTSAVKPDNPELRQARNLGIPVMERARLLGEISSDYQTAIAVSGAHGKTTTTAMTACCLIPLDPTVHMGGYYRLIGGNVRLGGDQIFITEACEYKRSFLTLRPTVAVVLNIDADHLDYYRDISDITEAFGDFCSGVREGGTLVINGDDRHCRSLIERATCRVVTFGFGGDNDYSADGVAIAPNGCCSFYLRVKGQRLGAIRLAVQGEHNVQNALAAIAASVAAGLPLRTACERIALFDGVDRRFQKLPVEVNGATVYLDYAHHPAELIKSLQIARKITSKKVIAVFQPHTFSRTKALKEEFCHALSLADDIIVADIYAAREAPLEGVTSQVLADSLQSMQKSASNPHSFAAIKEQLKTLASDGDIIMILGAGDIDKLYDEE